MTQKSVSLKKTYWYNYDKYITAPEFNTLAAYVFKTRLVQANLVTKTDFDAKLLSLKRKINVIKLKHLLVENELKKLKTYSSDCLVGKTHFGEDGIQNYLVF